MPHDDHSNFMRTQAMSARMMYDRPLPVNRIVNAIADSKFPVSILAVADTQDSATTDQ